MWEGLNAAVVVELFILLFLAWKAANKLETGMTQMEESLRRTTREIVEGNRIHHDEHKKDQRRDHEEIMSTLEKVEGKMTREHTEEHRNTDKRISEVEDTIVEELKEGFTRLEDQLKEQREDRRETNDLLRQVVGCLQGMRKDSEKRDGDTHTLVEQMHRRIINGGSSGKS